MAVPLQALINDLGMDSRYCCSDVASLYHPIVRIDKHANECTAMATRAPIVDIFETNAAYHVAVELPGVPKDSVQIELDNGMLTITAGAAAASVACNEKQKDEKTQNATIPSDGVVIESVADEENVFNKEELEAEKQALLLSKKSKVAVSKGNNTYIYQHCERKNGPFKRCFRLSSSITSSCIKTSYNNGLLQLTITKPIKKPERISIM